MQKPEGTGDAEDYTESDDEGADGYRKGGYHPVAVGEVYNGRYTVIAKLGWGHFSTVWLCQDMMHPRYVAMKVQKSAPHYTEAAYDEIELLAQAAKRGNAPDWDASQRGPARDMYPQTPFSGVVQLVDYFEHTGPNGKHVCMVFEPMGPNVLALIKRYNFKGVPLEIVRKVAAHVLIGLDYMHRVCGIIHTNLKPENVLVACPRGIPVNKHGLPLIGNFDAASFAAKQQSVMEKLSQPKGMKAKDSKKGRKCKKGIDDPTGDIGVDDASEVVDGVPRPPDGQAAAFELSSQMVVPPPPPQDSPGTRNDGPKYPPYMKPLLKPSRSDPTLLSSYGDDHSMLAKPPYHHYRAAMPHGDMTTGATITTAANLSGAPQ